MTQCEDMNVYYQERLPSPEKRRNYTGRSGISNQTGSPWRGKQSPRGRGAHEQLSQDDDQMCVTPQPVPSPPRHSASPALHLLPGQISAVADSLALNSDGHKSGRTGKREGDPTGLQPTEALLMPSQCLVPPNQFPPDPKPPLCWVCGASSWGLQQAMSSVHICRGFLSSCSRRLGLSLRCDSTAVPKCNLRQTQWNHFILIAATEETPELVFPKKLLKNYRQDPVHMTPDYSKTYIFHEGNSPHLLMTNPKNSTSSFFIFCELQSIPSDQLLKTRALVAGKLQYAEVKEIQLKRLKMKSNPVYENENLSQCKATGDVL
ncbi:hypothetical protein MJG53_013768 [Ovis ammon polii x Ovis aries]|uniref:Uncharacterized protein n=1 Tax=Ovis ammon polii x Ovis aries TaxID=2918886 RepID=A0ACB9UJW3_9CETA|nr:hypothetical protein MJG53_013768 [Ovis ammon polii x Ovis aries]